MLTENQRAGNVVVFRVDASTAVGTGHVMRCLALAEHWRARHGSAAFAMAEVNPALQRRLTDCGCEVVVMNAVAASAQDADRVGTLAAERGAKWVIVDGYHFGADYQKLLRDAGLRVLFVDDYGHSTHYYANMVLNQNAYAAESLYPRRESDTGLLLGSQFVLLRPEFEARRSWRREIKAVGRKLLVTMGGSDPENETAKVLRALPAVAVDGLEILVLLGGSNPYAESLRKTASSISHRLKFVEDSSDVAELMTWPDAAISAAGTTCWEMCFLGLPFLTISVASNQQPIAHELQKRGAGLHLGSSSQVTSEKIAIELTSLLQSATRREGMSRSGRALIDGYGAQRVIAAMLTHGLRLRPVREDDCGRLWQWANDPLVRQVSFSSQTIPWDQHVKWFQSRLADSTEMFLIVEDSDDRPVGQIRYTLGSERAEVSITMDPDFRGKGLGSAALSMATTEVFRKTGTVAIDAWIKAGNEASMNAFARAGYRRLEVSHVKGHEAVRFVAEKNA
jgi:UDP-2,4-diacetamido-2,4,6-trideoxy-beta-L-altropyranose hydrolase